MDKIKALADYVRTAKRIVFFGGAGVSTESGIPDFRSEDGLYHQSFVDPPETVLSHSYFYAHTETFYRFYRERMIPRGIEPNTAHKVLAKWEAEGRLLAVVTQNIDGLHQAAGSKKVYELHGTVHRNRCLACHHVFPMEAALTEDPVPHCPDCGGLLKPEVVLYEEPLDERVITGTIRALDAADLLIIGGTSLAVYPAASFIDVYHGGPLVVINKSATPRDGAADLVINEPIGEVLGKVDALIGE